MDNFLPKDYTKVQKILELGYPAVHEHLAEIILWLQDMNWPGSSTIANFLVSIGEPVIPHVKQVLAINDRGQDTGFKYNILEQVVEKWPREFVHQIESELMNLIWHEREDLDIEAIKVLSKHKLGDESKIRHAVENKIIGSEYRLAELRKIENYLSTYGA